MQSYTLKEKSIHELRSIAQAFGVTEIFEKPAALLAQEIELKQKQLVPPKEKLPDPPIYDARLMTKEPSEQASPESIVEMLKDYIPIGLRVDLSEERWKMTFGIKSDEGTMRMPLRTILLCARRLMT